MTIYLEYLMKVEPFPDSNQYVTTQNSIHGHHRTKRALRHYMLLKPHECTEQRPGQELTGTKSKNRHLRIKWMRRFRINLTVDNNVYTPNLQQQTTTLTW